MKTIIKDLFKWFSCIWMKIKNPSFSLVIGSKVCFVNVDICENGRGNSMSLGTGVSLRNCHIHIQSSNNQIIIHENSKMQDVTFWIEDDNNVIEIGHDTTFHGKCQLAACEGTKITIGDDCMFSHDIYCRTTDSHSILNEHGIRINPAKDIKIGNHVWIGMQCLILKDCNIPDNSIIGARSMVTSSIESTPNSLFSGNPARIIKNNINWDRQRK